ncbi:MAG: FKBP-type peptidyl-prolyl cis-trans isomerase [Lachnospiraceae bacterium]|nr:FKBP-type peptidyl-prolyl cis-trans isomerase [Lachnospiraceae bacterium]
MKKRYVMGFILLLFLAGIAGALTMRVYYRDRIDDAYIRLSGYKHLSIKIEKKKTISKQEIENAVMDQLTADNVYMIDKTSKVKKGDILNLSFQGYLDAEADRASMEQENYDLEIGSDTFIDGFEDGLIGKKPGTNIKMKLKFPDTYKNEVYAGQEVIFRVKLNYIKKRYTKDTLSDKIVKKNTSYKSVEDLYQSVKLELKETQEEEYRKKCVERIWKQLLKKTKVKKYNKEYLEEEGQKFDATYDDHAKELGVTSYEFISDYCGYSLKEYSKLREKESKQFTEKRMIAEAIAKKEHIEADSYDELLKKVEKMLLNETKHIYE